MWHHVLQMLRPIFFSLQFRMESRKHCCVGQCNARYLRTGSRLSSTFLFQFPDMSKDGRRWKLWKSFVNVTRKDFVPTRTSYVCSSHFTEDSYDNCLQYDWAISVDPKRYLNENKMKNAGSFLFDDSLSIKNCESSIHY